MNLTNRIQQLAIEDFLRKLDVGIIGFHGRTRRRNLVGELQIGDIAVEISAGQILLDLLDVDKPLVGSRLAPAVRPILEVVDVSLHQSAAVDESTDLGVGDLVAVDIA